MSKFSIIASITIPQSEKSLMFQVLDYLIKNPDKDGVLGKCHNSMILIFIYIEKFNERASKENDKAG